MVFIGNSITLHERLPEIGWLNAWGMAASAADRDYVHIVTRGIEAETGRKADVRVRNLARFERNFENYDYSGNQDLIEFAPDFLIVALGENVRQLETQEDRMAYREAFRKLLSGFMQGRSVPSGVVRGVFWPNSWKDEMMESAANCFSIPFVKADIGSDDSMKAIALFDHQGVQAHPGDRGMAGIAERILNGLFPQSSIYRQTKGKENA